ncbi:MAG: L-rhamnose mutarotase [Lentisphaerae bacterium]|nr:L-rhamnose mutarotase [Lentisphaerota bacterium]
MKRVGFVLKVRQDKLAEYKKHHEAVWPEMQDALRRTGWHNYSLFLGDDGLLVGYVEVEKSFAESLAGMDREPINAKWQAVMAPFFETLKGGAADKSMVELKEVFHLA